MTQEQELEMYRNMFEVAHKRNLTFQAEIELLKESNARLSQVVGHWEDVVALVFAKLEVKR